MHWTPEKPDITGYYWVSRVGIVGLYIVCVYHASKKVRIHIKDDEFEDWDSSVHWMRYGPVQPPMLFLQE